MVFSIITAMSVLLLSILGVSSGLQHCPMSKEIKPCTCNYRLDIPKVMSIYCDKMKSYDQIVETFRGHFNPSDQVMLTVKNSDLADMQNRSFLELNMTIQNLQLHNDFMGSLNAKTFDGLDKVKFFSLADNNLEVVPKHLWKGLPHVKSVDMSRSHITEITEGDFIDLPYLETLTLSGNEISRMDRDVIPTSVIYLGLARNRIKELNDTLRNLSNLEWAFLSSNELVNIEGQLPIEAPKLIMLHLSQNKIETIPQQMKNYQLLESLFLQDNKLRSLDGAISKSRNLARLVLEDNEIEKLTQEDFTESIRLKSILLGHNRITSLNNSLSNLKNLKFLNVSYNLLEEFSFQEVVGLDNLEGIDLGHNKIQKLIGPIVLFQNMVDWNFKLIELRLDHNELETLNGALSGLNQLSGLYLSYNKLRKIGPDDLIGLDELKYLDLSHNRLTTLEETSKTFLPKLFELKASYNYLTILERDFHGLPVLCHADLSNNQIIALGRELVSKTRCKIEHGVHEGTWDTLKIYLEDNPILCDAALPDIVSLMEINHTRIIGVSYCPPLSEQPTTSKPNGFLGYIPENVPTPPPPTEPELNHQQPPDHTFNLKAVENVQYQIENQQTNKQSTVLQQPIAISLQKSENEQNTENVSTMATPHNGPAGARHVRLADTNTKIFREQGERINELASEIKELKTRLDQLSTQNELLRHQQFVKNITEVGKP